MIDADLPTSSTRNFPWILLLAIITNQGLVLDIVVDGYTLMTMIPSCGMARFKYHGYLTDYSSTGLLISSQEF